MYVVSFVPLSAVSVSFDRQALRNHRELLIVELHILDVM